MKESLKVTPGKNPEEMLYERNPWGNPFGDTERNFWRMLEALPGRILT